MNIQNSQITSKSTQRPYKVMLDATSAITEQLSKKIGDILTQNGVSVFYTNTPEYISSNLSKPQQANQEDVDIILSLMRPESKQPNTVSGISSTVYRTDGIADEFARNINGKLEELGFNDLGIHTAPNNPLLRNTKMPALIVNIGFVNNQSDSEFVMEHLDHIAQAIAIGILESIEEETLVGDVPYYRVQVGLFRNYNNATNLDYRLTEDGFESVIAPIGSMYAVLVGEFFRLDDAKEVEADLNKKGYDTAIIKY